MDINAYYRKCLRKITTNKGISLGFLMGLAALGLAQNLPRQGVSEPSSPQQERPKKVFINQFVQHPALDRTTQGIIEGLEKKGYQRGINLDLRVESAQANAALSSQIAAKFMSKKPDVVVGVATISAQSFTKYAAENKTKLVFSTVTDPLGAGLVQDLKTPGNHTSGVSNFVDVEPQLRLFQKIQPALQRLGFLYNPAEVNSVNLIRRLQELCPKVGMTLVLQTANKTADVPQGATKLAGAVDAIFISNDNTALSALQSILQIARKARIPVYVSDTDAVELGALAALGPNQYEVGVQTAALIVRILQGEDPGNIPVQFPEKTELYLNEDAAAALGMTFPADLKAEATQILPKSQFGKSQS